MLGIGRVISLNESLTAEPFILWSEVPASNAKEGDSSENNTGLVTEVSNEYFLMTICAHEVEVFGCHREKERRQADLDQVNVVNADGNSKEQTYRNQEAVPKNGGNIEGFPEAFEVEVRSTEGIRRHGEAEQRNQSIGSHSRHPSRRNERVKRHLAGQDGAEDDRTKYMNNSDSILGLTILVDLPNPV